MVSSGRWKGGGGRRPFSDDTVLELRRRWAAGETVAAVARQSGVSVSSMSRIVHGQTYADLPLVERSNVDQGNRGESNPSARLNRARVAVIKARLLLGHPQRQIGEDERVHASTISCIARGKTWTDVEPLPARQLQALLHDRTTAA